MSKKRSEQCSERKTNELSQKHEISKTLNSYWLQIYSTFVFSKFRGFVIICTGFWHLSFDSHLDFGL